MKRWIHIFGIGAIGIGINLPTWSASLETLNRYQSERAQPLAGQVDLLMQSVTLHFPRDVKTLDDALNYLLRFSGYHLAPLSQRSLPLRMVLEQPLPAVDRTLGPISLSTALMTLVGAPFRLTHDPISREINFVIAEPHHHRLSSFAGHSS